MLYWFTSNLLWTQGLYVALALGVLLILSIIFFPKALWILIPLSVFVFFFFRNPVRVNTQADQFDILCPTDGTVLDVAKKGDMYHVSIFLSVFNVHVNWIPTNGVIKSITYRPGKFMVAFHPKSSDFNERNDVVIKAFNGKEIEVRQIAGIVARRICWWISPEESVEKGNSFGMIRFGSRIDILVKQSDADIYLKKGQKVKGVETVIGRWKEN